MSIVVDASLLVALASRDARSQLVLDTFLNWHESGASLHAPELALYEVASGLTRLVASKAMEASLALEAWEQLTALPVTYHSFQQGPRTVEVALALKRSSAYDAAYIALAEILGAELWTLDGRLFRNASPLGFPVRCLSPDESTAALPESFSSIS